MDAELDAAIKHLNELARTYHYPSDRNAWNLVRSALYHVHGAADALLESDSSNVTKRWMELRRAVEGPNRDVG
jgi:hypothetical protein